MERELKITASAVLIGSILLVAFIAYQSSLSAGKVIPSVFFLKRLIKAATVE